MYVYMYVTENKNGPPPQYPTPLHYVTISTVQAQELITRLQRRELYKSVDEITIPCEVSNEECGARGGGTVGNMHAGGEGGGQLGGTVCRKHAGGEGGS